MVLCLFWLYKNYCGGGLQIVPINSVELTGGRCLPKLSEEYRTWKKYTKEEPG